MMRSFIAAVIIYLSFAGVSFADGFQLDISPVWWQYKESAGTISGFPATPLHSKVSGFALSGKGLIALNMNQLWAVTISAEGLFPARNTTEYWSLNPAIRQQNQLNIKQVEYRLEVKRRIFDTVQAGLWASYQWHKQARSHFISNGIRQSQGTVHEVVKTAWVGLSLSSTSPQGLTIQLEGGLPVSVHATNDLVPSSFNRRSGFRAGMRMDYTLPTYLQRTSDHITLAYQFRELGNEQLSNKWLWPKNRWQTLSLGLSVVW